MLRRRTRGQDGERPRAGPARRARAAKRSPELIQSRRPPGEQATSWARKGGCSRPRARGRRGSERSTTATAGGLRAERDPERAAVGRDRRGGARARPPRRRPPARPRSRSITDHLAAGRVGHVGDARRRGPRPCSAARTCRAARGAHAPEVPPAARWRPRSVCATTARCRPAASMLRGPSTVATRARTRPVAASRTATCDSVSAVASTSAGRAAGSQANGTKGSRPRAARNSRRRMPPAAVTSARAGRRLLQVRDRVHEHLELLGRPALEDAVAEGLVGGHDRVAVVPVEARLGVDPEGAAGALGHLRQHLGVRLAAVGAGVAEDDHRRARVEVVHDLVEELQPDAAVVGVAGHVGDAGVGGDLARHRLERPLALEDVGHLGDALHEHERAQLAELVVQRVQHRQEEDAGAGHARRDVAEHVQLGPARAARAGTSARAARRRSGATRASCGARPPARSAAGRGARGRARPAAASSAPPPGAPATGPGPGWSAGCGRTRAAAWRAAATASARSSGARARAGRAARTPGARRAAPRRGRAARRPAARP